MAKESKAPVPPPVPPDHEKPKIAEPRPGTAGTEALLVTNTRQASDRFRQAQRAERMYRAKKRSAVARADYVDAKDHLYQGLSHLKKALKLGLSVARHVPYVLSEKKEEFQIKADEKKRQRALEQEENWGKKLDRDSAVMDGLSDDEAAKGAPTNGESSGANK